MATHGVVTPPFAQAWLRLALTHTFCFIHSECRQSIDSLVIAPIPQQDLRARAETDSKMDRTVSSTPEIRFLEGMAGCKKTKVFRHWMWSTTQQQTKPLRPNNNISPDYWHSVRGHTYNEQKKTECITRSADARQAVGSSLYCLLSTVASDTSPIEPPCGHCAIPDAVDRLQFRSRDNITLSVGACEQQRHHEDAGTGSDMRTVGWSESKAHELDRSVQNQVSPRTHRILGAGEITAKSGTAERPDLLPNRDQFQAHGLQAQVSSPASSTGVAASSSFFPSPAPVAGLEDAGERKGTPLSANSTPLSPARDTAPPVRHHRLAPRGRCLTVRPPRSLSPQPASEGVAGVGGRARTHKAGGTRARTLCLCYWVKVEQRMSMGKAGAGELRSRLSCLSALVGVALVGVGRKRDLKGDGRHRERSGPQLDPSRRILRN
ncbi:hypothetical protein B0H19DRAFT_1061267 [Mycena capillaripes]|nr:hypothetical protein B0H19DRAFT_1061267 [Mycena capillaripes]